MKREQSDPEPLGLRYMSGYRCDMWSGPCACGAWHHPGDEFKSLPADAPGVRYERGVKS